MSVSHEFANELLAEVVGKEWVSDDRTICEAYSKDAIVGVVRRKHRKDSTTVPEFVVLPASTEEVAAVLKIADRYGLKVIPIGTGANMSGLCIPGRDGFRTISLDLKRMDRILEIDDVNMTARIQPYVSIARVQAETMKRGLWNGGSPLAPASVGLLSNIMFSGGSTWQSALNYGLGVRSLVNFTVVLPNGDILKSGSLTLPKAGDFYWSGPGPELKGLFEWGHCGAFGVLTEATVKLYPWAGGDWPEEKVYDRPPLPKNHRIFWIQFPGFDELRDAVIEICHAGIGTHLNGASDTWNSNATQRTSALTEKVFREGYFPQHLIYIVLAGLTSEKQLDYEEKVLRQIVEECKGEFMEGEFLETASTWNFDAFRTGDTVRACRTGSYAGLWMGFAQIEHRQQYFEDKQKLIKDKPHQLLDNETPYVYVADRGYFSLFETDTYYDQSDSKQVDDERELVKGGFITLTMNCRLGFLMFPEPLASIFGSQVGPNFHLLSKNMKNVFDPNDTMNPAKLVTMEPKKEQ